MPIQLLLNVFQALLSIFVAYFIILIYYLGYLISYVVILTYKLLLPNYYCSYKTRRSSGQTFARTAEDFQKRFHKQIRSNVEMISVDENL